MRRPIDIWIVSIYFALNSVCYLLVGIWCIEQMCPNLMYFDKRTALAPMWVGVLSTWLAAPITSVLLGLLLAAVALSLWSLRPWARATAIVLLSLACVQEILAIAEKLRGKTPDYFSLFSLAFDVIVIGYLLRPATRHIFIQRSSGQSSS